MKKNMKKILAFLCAVVLFVTAVFTENAMNQAQAEDTSSTETSTEPTPVELYGFENVTLNDFVHVSTGSAMHEGEYVYGTDYTYTNSADTNFDKQLFSANVKFITSGGWWTNVIRIGGTASNWGIGVGVNGTEQLMISELDADWDGDGNKEFERTITADQAGVTSFGESFLLQIGYEYLTNDTDGEANDVRVLVYVNGTEVLNEVVSNCDMTRFGNYVRFYIENSSDSIVMTDVELPVEPVELTGFNNVTPGDFTNTSASTTMEETTYTTDQTFTLTNETDFNKKLFTAYVKPANSTNWWGWRICLGGTSSKWGVALCVNSSGDTLTVAEFDSDIDENSDQQFSHSISASTAKVTSFVTEPFLLQMGLEYLDNGGDGSENDVRVLLYVNGNAVFNQVLSNCNMSNLGNYLRFYLESGSIEVGTFQSEVKPVTLSSHDTVTISDFQDSTSATMESKAYDYDGTTPNSQFYLKDGSSNFKDKLLSMKVKFGYKEGATPSWETRMAIGADNAGGGLFVYVDSNDILHIDDKANSPHNETITPTAAGVSSFLNTPFIFQMSFADTANGLEAGVYINGKLCTTYRWNDENMNEATGDYTAHLNLNRGIENSFITVSDVDAKEFPGDPLILPDSTFEKITFGSFGIVDGTYNSQGSNWVFNNELKDRTNLDKIVLCGNIKLNDEAANQTFDIVLGSKNNESWNGMKLWINGSTMSLSLNGVRPDEGGTLNSETAGVGTTFANNNFPFMWSVEFVCNGDDNTYNDIKVGLWFNNVLYEDKYFTFSDGGTAEELGNTFAVCCEGTSTSITLGSVEEYLPQPDESYEKVTFQHFLIEDGTYESEGSNLVFEQDFKMKDNLDKIVVCGDVLLTDSDGAQTFDLILGNKNGDSWEGIKLWINGSNMVLNLGTEQKNLAFLNSETAGVGTTFANNKFALMWSVEFVCNDGDNVYNDIEVGLWFNGFLYNNEPFTITNGGTAAELGDKFSVCCETTGTSITLNSVSELAPQPDESLQKLSLPDFVHNGTEDIMESGTFSSAKSDGWYVSGNAKDGESLDKKVVSFDVLQSGTAGAASYRMRIGGISNHWYGLVLNTGTDGNMMINWCKSSDGQMASEWATVDMNEAAVSSFVNETFNLMVSMELIEVNDNTTSDVKVRIWFNKIPYVHDGQDSFIYYDCGEDIGNILAVGIDKATGYEDKKAFVSLRTVAEYQSNPNYYEDISEYRQGTGYTAPDAPEGYVFSGWYADEDYETALARDKVDGSAYAKYTEDDVLKVKAQVKLSDGALPTDETALRFVTTVDSLKYRNVAFKYEIQMSDGSFSTEYDSYATSVDKELAKKVYRKMYYVGQDTGELSYKPNAFSWMSEYFKAWTLSGIKAAQYDTTIRITPYWITMDGTTVEGETRDVCVNDFDVSAYENTSQAVTIDFLGQNTMPIGGLGLWPTTDEDTMLFPDYVTEEYFKLFADAGVNLLVHSGVDYKYDSNSVKKQLEYGEKYGIGVFVEDSELHTIAATGTDAQLAARLNEYSGYKAFSGIHLIDEPGVEGQWGYDSSQSAEANKSYTLYTTLAGKLKDTTLSNSIMYPLFPSWSDNWLEQLFGKASEEDVKTNYKNYVNTISSNLQNNIISWDHYPFEVERVNADADIYSTYFWNMDLIRTTAQNASKPFWAVIQAGSQWNNEDVDLETEKNTDGTAIYYPTQSQFNWNVNTSLAFGAQGIQYFPLVQMKKFAKDNVDAEWDFERNGLLSAWGGKTQWYYYAQEMNKQIAAIDEVLMNSVNEGVIASGTTATYVNGLDAVKTNYGKLSSVNGNALVGCFNYSGKTALYVVNCDMYDHNSTTSQDTTQDITLQFTENCSMKRIQKAKTDEVSTESNNQLTLTIEAGEGVLLVLE